MQYLRDTYDRDYYEDKTCFVASLTNGLKLYQDDFNGGSAWLELIQLISENNYKINDLFIKFRTEEVHPLPKDCDGYYFAKGFLGALGGGTQKYYVLGAVQNSKFLISEYSIPELQLLYIEERVFGQDTKIAWNINPNIMMNQSTRPIT